MAIAPARLAGPTQPGTADTTIYTAPAAAGSYVIVKEIVLTNTTATAATVTLSIGAVAAAADLLAGYSVPANSTSVIALSTVLNAGETLHALQGTASAVTVTVSGVTGP